MIKDLYKENEQGIDVTLQELCVVAGKKYGLIKQIKRVRQYYDDPKFWYYSADIKDSFIRNEGRHFQTKASGTSLFSQKEALLKCLGETIERYCNFVFLESTTSYKKKIKSMIGNFIDPRSITSFSDKQLTGSEFTRFRIDDNSEFRWTACTSLLSDKTYRVPSQFIYLSYPYLKNEPSIYQGISTGVAGGANLSAAITRGICEIIERDAFMIFYLNSLIAPKIDLEKIENPEIKRLLLIANRYKMEIVSLDITTDLGIPTVLSMVINRSEFGKAVSVGLKCDFDYVKAISGSAEEAFHTRAWLRSDYEDDSRKKSSINLLKKDDIRWRGLLWYSQDRIKKLDFWLKSKRLKKVETKGVKLTSGQKLEKLVNVLEKMGYDAYYKDITIEKIRSLKYFVVKVIIPKMQPLYLDENHPLLGGERLATVPKKLGYESKKEGHLNRFPHPFL